MGHPGKEGLQADPVQQARFGEYFPRLFAYAYRFLDDEDAAKKLVITALSRALSHHTDLNDEQFSIMLFGIARDLCHSHSVRHRVDDGLNLREREAISLTFDACLTRSQIGRVLSIRSDTVASALLSGLKKLRATLPATRAVNQASIA